MRWLRVRQGYSGIKAHQLRSPESNRTQDSLQSLLKPKEREREALNESKVGFLKSVQELQISDWRKQDTASERISGLRTLVITVL